MKLRYFYLRTEVTNPLLWGKTNECALYPELKQFIARDCVATIFIAAIRY